jgi:hypothetical protein
MRIVAELDYKTCREIRYDPLPNEVGTVVIAAWTRGGMLPNATIENMVPKRSAA